jgi:hypothetical protein
MNMEARTRLGMQNPNTAPLSLVTKEIKMTLVQKSINGHEYFTDDKVYYTFQQVNAATDTLWSFACKALGINKQSGFNSQETKDITDLAGIGPFHPTRFLLLKDGKAIPVAYLANGGPNLHPNDIILRSVVSPVSPAVPEAIAPVSESTRSVAERLKEIENLHNMKLLTDAEYQEKRARLIAAL